MSSKNRYEQALRLAAHRLELHASRTEYKVDALEQPMGFGEDFDRANRASAQALRRDAAKDRACVAELRALKKEIE